MALLNSVIRWPLDEEVRDRIVAETRGNPLALLELPRGLSHVELAGGFGLPASGMLAGHIEESFRQRGARLPTDSQRLLLVAAAEPVGEPVLVWNAARELGIGLEAAAPASAAGLCDFGARVRFRHPLVRSAVYRGASPGDRRSVHRALAAATDPVTDPDRRAWHRAHAAAGPDEDVAGALERSAAGAQARGGLAAAAAFLRAAAGLTPDPARRAARALAAAQAQYRAGAFDAALEMLVTAEAGPLDELQRAQVDLVRAQVSFALSRGSEAPLLLLKAAKRLEPVDVSLARETYLDAVFAALFADRLGPMRQVAAAAKLAPAAPPPGGPADRFLDGMVAMILEDYADAAPALRGALEAFRDEGLASDTEFQWIVIAAQASNMLWDFAGWRELCARQVQLTRDAGALVTLPIALIPLIVGHVLAGELVQATSLLEELKAVTEATGSPHPLYCDALVSAWQGRESESSTLIEAGLDEAVGRGEGLNASIVEWASAVLWNGLGRYQEALDAATHAGDDPQIGHRAVVIVSTWGLIELVEAAARCGEAGLAADALRRLSERTRPSGTDWALGIEARSRALLSDGEAADHLYREAIERLRRGGPAGYLARTHLVYGEWLRRERRRLDAREHLRIAYELCSEMGFEAFAARAARELRAAGEKVPKRSFETSAELTPQEAQIARLAGEGLSNPDIGSRLFISPRTVQYHLHKVFTKLDITSRRDLGAALAGAGRIEGTDTWQPHPRIAR
ncbi:helix-turn-helix transcriptional regulator [Solirubrobacter ginsenosidimutans]|uniref:Helix-turn-helix transcriptional regulator n=1 Tax=Solirubrobacter ginsenosidimutans TaxID=490573 RepID=A0A9X3S2C9_9ACTN|nr:helix-turn-helix transcriptional regulator [Solirubrobacter ginsenosidimutans]MDA0164445.1 helix-turn-helix transcriptional regulator [Solirubrobacter ginsenosidimutans]